MCLPGQPPPGPAQVPATAADAIAMAQSGLAWLAAADPVTLTSAERAECLRALGRAESLHTAARSSILAAFTASRGYQDDGHKTAKTWLRWQTQITDGAASGAVGWVRRLAAHPLVRSALADAQISPSWARQVCAWTDLLPEGKRADADAVLLRAARSGADLEDLDRLAQEIRRHCAELDRDDDGFDDRQVRLETTFAGAGKLDGDLTPACAAALGAVLDALGKPAGPEDLRTKWQRRHDALEEGCRRLIAAGCLPGRAGQATQILLHMDLDRLRGMPGAAEAEAAWPGPAAPPGAECDATIVPVVTGHVDPDVLDRLAAALLNGTAGQRGTRAARQIVIKAAADLLSGPGGLAAYLRTRLAPDIVASVSLPLDVGTVTETIPVHLRRAVAARDRHCRWPGCHQPAMTCQPHHIIPRSQGGPTCLTNMILLCTFHHLIAIHRWGWGIVLLPDGSVTVTSPDGTRILRSHGPPSRAA